MSLRGLSYRTKARMRKGFIIILALAGVLLLAVILFAIYLGRFVVFTPQGVRLDFDRDSSRDIVIPKKDAEALSPIEDISIEFADPDPNSQETEKTSGYYIDLEMLQDPNAVLAAIQELSPPCTVLIDLKGGNGSFYYTTAINNAQQASIDVATVDTIISHLRNHGFTMVARIKTFQDTHFAEEHANSALLRSNGTLWLGNGFYWLDPDNPTVLAYLKQIARELAEKGFKEIVLDDFRFPNGNQIVYNSDKNRTELISDVAEELLNFFASSNITISFGNPTTDFAPHGTSRIYVTGVTGSGVNATVKNYALLEDAKKQLIFLTASKDRRFEDYQVLRPLLSKVQ